MRSLKWPDLKRIIPVVLYVLSFLLQNTITADQCGFEKHFSSISDIHWLSYVSVEYKKSITVNIESAVTFIRVQLLF